MHTPERRQVALDFAIKAHKDAGDVGSMDKLLETAAKFDAFLLSGKVDKA